MAEYSLKINKRSRRMKLTIHPDGRLVATVPEKYTLSSLERFIESHADWIARKLDYFQKKRALGIILPEGTYRQYRKIALDLAQARMEYFNQFYGFEWKKITIRNQKRRWGSCSRAGNISLKYKIALLPAHLADYVIVHELCHLGEFNHSKAFWNLVARTIPDHLKRRQEMRRILR